MAEFHFPIYFRRAAHQGEIWSQAVGSKNQGLQSGFYSLVLTEKA
jgi:hypothetical protein